jgi:mannose-6-phosphate isomerase-like protein (cupin superfamily)
MQIAQSAENKSTNPIDISGTPELQTFKMKAPLVEVGTHNVPLAKTENTWMLIRVYAPKGGENALHSHRNQDHSFVVLQGQARFTGARGEQWVLNKHEGILIPSGAYYCFENSGKDSLVLLRFGARVGDGDATVRIGVHGEQIHPHAPENNRPRNVVYREGEFFE